MDFPYSVVAITGGTGSFGHALTAHLLATYPGVRIRVISRGEHRQAAMQAHFPQEKRLSFLIGDVRDFQRMQLAFQGVDLVCHSAALKRIEVAEYNPYEAVATNIMGTWNVLQAARDVGVRQVVTISSDKACRSETLYGSTKNISERLTIQGNHYGGNTTRYCAVRYGNVASSAGSVIPFWQACVLRGEPLQVTHHAMSRFWLSMIDAVRFVCFVAAQQSRGGLFIPHLPAFHVTDLARAILGLPEYASLHEGKEIVTIGLRGAEKIAEDLATDTEISRAYWYASGEDLPVTYLVPPAMQYWETPVIGTGWLPPPAPCLTGEVAGSPGPAVAYNSGTWPWRLSVEDIRQRLVDGER